MLRVGVTGHRTDQLAGAEMPALRARAGQVLQAVAKGAGGPGIVLSPLDRGEASFALDWDWSRFSPAIIGNAVCTPELHHAGHHHFGGMRLALQKLIARGCRRIAAVIEGEVNERARRAWSAAFLEHHPSRGSARRWLQAIDTVDARSLRRWLKTMKPDALITTRDMLLRLEKAGITVREEVDETVLLNWTPASPEYGGIDQCEEVIAAHAVDLVVGQLHHNECGAPEHVKMLLFPGKWAEARPRTEKQLIGANDH